MSNKPIIISTLIIILVTLSLIFVYYGLNKDACISGGTMDIQRGKYMKLSASVAKASLDDDKTIILLDVRTPAEYEVGHIEGAILIPDYELANKVLNQIPDKNATIFVYCHSGVRSKNAANTLLDLGYMEVYDIGGIIDWPYDIAA